MINEPRHPIGTFFVLRGVRRSRFHDDRIGATVIGIGSHAHTREGFYTVEYTNILGSKVIEHDVGHATITRGIEKLRENC